MKQKTGITCGSFDLTHAGHYLMFSECKKYCDYLIVCLQTNPAIDRPDTKNTPIQSIYERYVQVSSCKYVDKIIVYETEKDLYDILCTVDFDIRFIGADWKEKQYTGHDIPGMKEKVFFNKREHSFSSSSLRRRVAEKECGEWIHM